MPKTPSPKNTALLNNWAVLNVGLMKLKEDEVWALLAHELAHRARHQIMLRLHGRGNKLRAIRERRDFMRGYS